MKLLTTSLIALLISVSAFAQQSFPRNEIQVNLGSTILFLYPEISYERILTEDTSIGVSIGFGGTEYFSQNFNFTPFFRWFLSGNRESASIPGAGFFIEANSSFYSRNGVSSRFDRDENTVYLDNVQNAFAAGIGLAIGWKHVTQNNWVGEFMLGGGRNLVDNGAYPRIGISIGRRF